MVLAETEKMTKLKFLTKTIDKPLKKNVRFSTFSNWYFLVKMANLVPRAFPSKNGWGREKALASAGHVSTRTP